MNNEWKLIKEEECNCDNKQYCNHSYNEIFKNLIREKINKPLEYSHRMNMYGFDSTYENKGCHFPKLY